MNFPFSRYNIPEAVTYGVCICQLYRYSRPFGSYHNFPDRWLLLIRKLLNHGLLVVKLKSSLRTIYGGHHDLGSRYGVSVSQMFHLMVITIWSFLRSSLIIGFVTKVTRRLIYMQQALPTLSDQMSSSPDLSGVRGARPLVFCVMFWKSFCVRFPLVTGHCLSFFDLRVLIILLISLNISWARPKPGKWVVMYMCVRGINCHLAGYLGILNTATWLGYFVFQLT